jgi:hypothetical protein
MVEAGQVLAELCGDVASEVRPIFAKSMYPMRSTL